jgi:hypothetical protein
MLMKELKDFQTDLPTSVLVNIHLSLSTLCGVLQINLIIGQKLKSFIVCWCHIERFCLMPKYFLSIIIILEGFILNMKLKINFTLIPSSFISF